MGPAILAVVLVALVPAACSYREPPSNLPFLLPPLHASALRGDIGRAEEFLSKNADVDATDNFNNTPLVYAAIGGHARMAALLIARGADVNGAGGNPLRFSVKNGHEAVVGLLLDGGADVQARDPDGNSPLHLAVLRDRTDIARLLIGKGADVNARMEMGDTPLHIAARNNNRRLCEMLLQHGADVHALDAKGRTPLACVEDIRESYRRQESRKVPVPPGRTDYSSVIGLLRRHGGGMQKGS